MSQHYKGILVFIEQRDGTIEKVSLELLGKARSLSEALNQPVSAALIGHDVKKHVNTLYHYGADQVYLVEAPQLNLYLTESYAIALTDIIKMMKPEIGLIGATSIGRDLAPRVAARLETGLTADCTSLEIESETGKLQMTRPAFGGNIMATIICPDHYPQMSTVRPGVMSALEKDTERVGELIEVKSDLSSISDKVKILEVVKAVQSKKKIEEANILISAGRGIGSKENLVLLESFAEAIGGLVSGSRAVVDQGWIDHGNQVGQTGKTVRPDVYFACGISGAIQHVTGMEDSGLIIAINKDPEAPIFKVADVGIVGDVTKVIPQLTEALTLDRSEKVV